MIKQTEAMKLALEALEYVNRTGDTQTFDMCYAEPAITAIKEALAEQPAQQEPVAWLHPANATCVTTDPSAYARGVPLYTSPPAQRTWVGLEQSDMPDGADPLFDDPKFIAGMVYAANKLMEKNT